LNGSEAAAQILVQTLDSASARERQMLVAEITLVRDHRASPLFCYLVRHLNRSRYTELYLATLDMLGTFGDPEAIEALKVALHRRDFWAPFRTRRARAAAAAALRRIGTPAALDVLKSASASGSRGARAAARAQVK
jgi:HEAT repeat protein